MNIVPRHRWIRVENQLGTSYSFPDLTSKHLKGNWGGPAVYRWLVHRHKPGDINRLYIGETHLLPSRIDGYRNPGRTQQTNIRINKEFNEYLIRGSKITLDVLDFESFDIDGTPLSLIDLNDKWVRCMLQDMFIVHFSRSGYIVLNA